eukprot:s2270_g1.t1
MAVLDLLAAGLTSLCEIGGEHSGAGEYAETRRLNLHMNRICDLEGISQFPFLEELILSGNCIRHVRPADFTAVADHLKLLDLSCNELQGLESFKGLYALEQLHLAYNRIESLEGMMNFWGRRHRLNRLDLRCNRIEQVSQLLFLGGCTALEQVAFQEKASDNGNSICDDPMYRTCVFRVLPWLRLLDDVPQDAPVPAVREIALENMRSQLAKATLDLQAAQEEAKVATEEAQRAKRQATEATLERDRAAREAESQRETRLRVDLEEIVVAVQKHEDQFAQQVAQLSAADEELPAAERVQEEEASAWSKEERRCLELSNSEKHEASLAARWKSEKLEAEQMLLRWASGCTYSFPDVQTLRGDLQRTSAQLQEVRYSLKCFDDEELQRLATAVEHEENSMVEAQKNICEQEQLARCWHLETAAAAGRLAALRGSEVQQARAGAEEMEAEEMMLRRHEESLSQCLAEEAALQAESSLRPVDPDGQGAAGARTSELWSLVRARDDRVSEIQEMRIAAPDAEAVSILEEKLQSALDQARQGFEQSRSRLSNLQSDLAQKAKALELAQKQEDLDKVVLGEMNLQLQRRKDAEKDTFVKVSQRLADTTSIEFQVHEVQESFKDIQKKIQELEDLRGSCARQVDYKCCVQAVQAAEAELAKLGEEKSQRSCQLEALQSALEKRREELRTLVLQLQETQADGEAEERKLKVKTQMIADARKQVGDLRRSIAEADKFKQENDVAWRDRLTEATASAEDYFQRSDELHESSVQQEEEVAKLSRVVKAKGERNNIVQLQLDHVQLLTEEQKSRLEEKVEATQAEGAQILNEARWASAEMEERFRLQRAEQLQEERRQRCRLVMLQQQLQAAPSSLEKLRRQLAEERSSSKERLRRLLATFDGPRLAKSQPGQPLRVWQLGDG